MLDYVWMGYLLLIFATMVIEVLRSTNNTVQPKHKSMQETGATLHSKTKTQNVKRRQKVEQLNDVDYVPTNHTFFSILASVVYFWRQRSRDQKYN